jgi:hypothetical protein
MLRKRHGFNPKTPTEFAESVIDILNRGGLSGYKMKNTWVQVASEAKWMEEKRPYYNIWPSVIKPFTKVDLGKVKGSDIFLPLPRLLIRLPVGYELEGAKSIFVTEARGGDGAERAFLVAINHGEKMKEMPVHTINSFTCKEGCTVADRLLYGRENPYCDDELNEKMVDECVKLVVAICLLANNPDLIEQSPLEADRHKWEATHDIKLIEKAERRGKREWNVGNHIEVAPGYRNSHFAIRWTGRGATKPVLTPIKGCLVRRKAIEEVPTGWLDEDESKSGSSNQQC